MNEWVMPVLMRMIGADHQLANTRLEKKGKGFKFFGNMWWEDESEKQRSVVYDRNLKKKPCTKTKPRLFYNQNEYSWRLEKEVVIEKGDYIFIGSHGRRSDGNWRKIVYVIRVVDIVKKAPITESSIALDVLEVWESSNVNQRSLSKDTLKEKYLEGAKKALSFKRRDRFWFLSVNPEEYSYIEDKT